MQKQYFDAIENAASNFDNSVLSVFQFHLHGSKLGLVSLTILKHGVQKLARLLVTLVLLKALEKHCFIVPTRIHILLLESGVDRSRLGGGCPSSTAASTAHDCSYSLVSDGGTGTERHT
jgi:hypothetical protein